MSGDETGSVVIADNAAHIAVSTVQGLCLVSLTMSCSDLEYLYNRGLSVHRELLGREKYFTSINR